MNSKTIQLYKVFIFSLLFILGLSVYSFAEAAVFSCCYNECNITDPNKCDGDLVMSCFDDGGCDDDIYNDWCEVLNCADAGAVCVDGACVNTCDNDGFCSASENIISCPMDCYCRGDLNDDGLVDSLDSGLLFANYGRTDCGNCVTDCIGDIDCDGDVDGVDLAAVSSDMGREDCSVCDNNGVCDLWETATICEDCICKDADNDGYGLVVSSSCTFAGLDCNDNNSDINPGAIEICGNDIDDNCSGVENEGCEGVCDTDGDGFDEFFWCLGGGENTDCNDDDKTINPSALEICDGIDNNCNYIIDEGCDSDNDNYCACDQTFAYGSDLSRVCPGTNSSDAEAISNTCDCNDNDSVINPGASEICDNDVDENCNGVVDDGCEEKRVIFYESFDSYDSIENNNGVYLNLNLADSDFGKAGYFTKDSMLDYPSGNNIELEKGTIKFRIKPDWDGDDNKRYNIFNWSVGDNKFRIFKYYSSASTKSYFVVRFDDADGMHEVSTSSFEPNELMDWKANDWHDIEVSWDFSDDGKTFIYFKIDNTFKNYKTYKTTFSEKPDRFYIGNDSTNTYPLNGYIDEFKIYNYSVFIPGDVDSYRAYTEGDGICQDHETIYNSKGDCLALEDTVYADKDYLFFEKESFVKVFEGSVPAESEIVDGYRANLPRNNFETLFVNLYSRKEVDNLVVRISDFQGKVSALSNDKVKLYAVSNWWQAGITAHKSFDPVFIPELLLEDDDFVFNEIAWSNDNLPSLPVQGFVNSSIQKNTSKQFAIVLNIPENAVIDTYIATLSLFDGDNFLTSIDYEIEVLPFALRETEKDFLLYHQSRLSDKYTDYVGLDRFNLQVADIKQHGFNGVTSYSEVSEDLDFYRMDKYREIGFDGRMIFLGGYSDAIRDYMLNKGWEPYFYGRDEPNNDERLLVQITKSLQVHGGNSKIATAINSYTNNRLLNPADAIYDNFPEGTYEPLDLANLGFSESAGNLDYYQSLIAGTLEKTQYQTYYWQMLQEDPRVNRFLSGFFLWNTGIDGIFPYVYQSVRHNPYDDFDNWSDKTTSYRDHLVTYPSQEGPVQTIQWEALREGIDDHRYLETWEDYVEQAETVDEAKAEASRLVIDSLLEKYRDYSNMLVVEIGQYSLDRDMIQDEILKLKKMVENDLCNSDELCDGLDNNCNDVIDEGCDVDNDNYCACDQTFAYGSDLSRVCPGTNSSDASAIANTCDCNEGDAAMNPGALELCNDGIDNNCDGTIDEGCSNNVEGSVGIGWSQPERVDENGNGAKPSIFYDPSGDLRIFYNVENVSTKLMTRLQLSGQSDFNAESFVYNNGHQIDLNYAGGAVIDAVTSQGSAVIVLQSIDNGVTWNFVHSYSGGNNVGTFPNYNSLSLYEDAGELRLAYTYEEDSFVFGSHGEVYSALRVGDVWGDANNIDSGTVHGISEAGANVGIISNGGVYYSDDNGVNYELHKGGATMATFLYASDSVVSPDGRMYILHPYSYGISPSRHIGFSYSDDNGDTWSNQAIVSEGNDDYYLDPKLIVENNTLVAIWQNYVLANQRQVLNMSYSVDGGLSWSAPETILTLSDNNQMEYYQSFDIASDGTNMSVLYSVKNQSRQGVYLIERKLPQGACVEDWDCTDWSDCVGGMQTRTCQDNNACGTDEGRPVEMEKCLSVIISNPNDGEQVIEDFPVMFDALVIGGTAPYEYIWKDNGVDFGENNQHTMLIPDSTMIGLHNISVSVSDANGLISVRNVEIEIIPSGTLTAQIQMWQKEFTKARELMFNVVTQGGTGPYNFQWTSDKQGVFSTEQWPSVDVSSWDFGEHLISVVVTDFSTGQTAGDNIKIELVELFVDISSPLSGETKISGEAVWLNTIVEGGVSPYFFKWASSLDGDITPGIGSAELFVKENLSVGTHEISLIVTDSSPVPIVASKQVYINISPAPLLETTINSPANSLVIAQGDDISFQGGVNGGVWPYVYSWTSDRDGELSSSKNFEKNNLSIGEHVITFEVKDNSGQVVEDSISITINKPVPLDAKIDCSSAEEVVYAGDSLVAFTSIVSGGVAPYIYQWISSLDGNISNKASFYKVNLSEGAHNIVLTITDQVGVSSTASIDIVVNPEPNFVNIKNINQYYEREAFLTSNKEWQTVLSLIPITTWEDNKYPMLVYHEEANIDIDSAIHFLQMYNPGRLTTVDSMHWRVNNLLTAVEPVGAGINVKNIGNINSADYFSYWNEINSVVVVDYDDYQAGLMAAVFASYKNAPLIFVNDNNLETYQNLLNNKVVYSIGSLELSVKDYIASNAKNNLSYNLNELQHWYITTTDTDKAIVVNSLDLNNDYEEYLGNNSYYTNKGGEIKILLSKLSLAAPYLAAGRQELILFDENGDIEKIDDLFQVAPEYITVMAAHDLFPDSNQLEYTRIAGVTSADTYSYTARSLFYEELFSRVYPEQSYSKFFISADLSCYPGRVLDTTNNYSLYDNLFDPDDYSYDSITGRQFVRYASHGSEMSWGCGLFRGSVLNFNNIPSLDLTWGTAASCSTGGFVGTKSFSYNWLRKGGIAYWGANQTIYLSQTTPAYKPFEFWQDGFNYDLGTISKLASGGPFLMYGDPVLKPIYRGFSAEEPTIFFTVGDGELLGQKRLSLSADSLEATFVCQVSAENEIVSQEIDFEGDGIYDQVIANQETVLHNYSKGQFRPMCRIVDKYGRTVEAFVELDIF